MNKPITIYITMGDPGGIGPEIIFKSLKEIKKESSISKLNCTFCLIGDENILDKYSSEYKVNLKLYTEESRNTESIFYQPVESRGSPGEDSLNYIDKAVESCLEKKNSGLVTAPVSKEAVSKVKKDFRGHTEYIGKYAGAENTAMTFISKKVKLSLLTTHLPLKEIAPSISKELIISHIQTVHNGLKKLFEMENPRIVICSLNPHMGEGGLLGTEEIEVYKPAVDALNSKGLDVKGPVSPSSALKMAVEGKYDFVVSSYHDQLLSGVKNFLSPCVNLTMGLPFVRTSPDHGPAPELTGKELADYSSMKMSIELAVKLTDKV
ncbi:MAG: PdxA family dehydrogenase [Elusimicrobiota bacterium]